MSDTPTYPAYDANKSQIRLLRFVDVPPQYLRERTNVAIVACVVEVFDLDDLNEEPRPQLQGHPPNLTEHDSPRHRWGDYIAVSYTWQPRFPLQKIIVNGDVVTVPCNLAQGLSSLLAYLQRIKQNLKVWNDFLCIDQNDKSEIQRDLTRMSFIFSNAYNVVSYIGPEADDSHLVLQRLLELERNDFAIPSAVETLQSIRDDEWTAITMFFHRPYWRRMWVVQEMALPGKKAILMCGNAWATMAALWCLVDLIFDNASLCHGLLASALNEDFYDGKLRSELFGACARLQFVNTASVALSLNQECNTLDILNICRGSLQQDARDKVYGILGLLPANVSKLIKPDLDKSTYEVYTDLITAVIRAKDRLDVLQNCRINSQRPPLFPTWVPDLEVYSLSHPLGPPGFMDADGSRSSGARFIGSGKFLACRGIVLDEIDHLTPPQWPLKPVTEEQRHESHIISARHTPSSVHETKVELWRTFVGGSADIGSDASAPEQYRCLLDLPWPPKIGEGNNHDIYAFAQRLIDLGWCTSSERQDLLTFLWFRERAMQQFDIRGYPLCTFFPNYGHSVTSPDVEKMNDLRWLGKALRQASATLKRRRLCVTSDGHLGASVREARRGDKIAILQGCDVPIILRPVSTSALAEIYGQRDFDQEVMATISENATNIQAKKQNDTAYFLVVGDCYVSGFMHGEAYAHPDDLVPQDIVLC